MASRWISDDAIGLDDSGRAVGTARSVSAQIRGAFQLAMWSRAPMLFFVGSNFRVYCNDAAALILQGQSKVLINCSMSDVGLEDLAEILQRAAESGVSVTQRGQPFPPGDRSLRRFDAVYCPVEAPDGAGSAVICVLTEVSAKEVATPTPVANVAQTGIESDWDDVAVISVDAQLRVTSWSEGATRILGFARSEVIGRPASWGLGQPFAKRDIFEKGLLGSGPLPQYMVLSHKSGVPVHLSVVAAPIRDAQDRIAGASIIARSARAAGDFRHLQTVLVAEMKHRVKNILSTVQAIARLTLGIDKSPEYSIFEARILALARAQDLITRERSDGVDLQALLSMILEPYPAEALSFAGPPIRVSSRAAVTLSLGIHELATNSVKYGAMSAITGRVAIEWSHAAELDGAFHLIWSERGGPPVRPPKRKGFGTILIESVMPSELQGQVEMHYWPEGVQCVLRAEATSVLEQTPLGLTG